MICIFQILLGARPSNSIASLLHGDILINLLMMLPKDSRKRIPTLYGEPIQTQEPVALAEPTTLQLIDRHGHLDLLIIRRQVTSFEELEKASDHEVELLGIIANFVYPHHWKSHKEISKNKKVKCSFGIHPRTFIYRSQIQNYLRELQVLHMLPNTIGLGEIGLEFTGTTTRKQKIQFEFLEVLKLYRDQHLEKVLILHCRDKNNGKAAKQVYDLLHRLGLSHWKIHRHCFSGSSLEVSEWASAFPNCLSGPMGISTLLIDPTQVESKKSSQIQWPVPSINAEPVDIFLGE